jgi:hypothetical protein
MKIKTDLHAGNYLQDAYDYVSDAVAGIPRFLREADEEAEMLFEKAVDSTQALWGKLTNMF